MHYERLYCTSTTNAEKDPEYLSDAGCNSDENELEDSGKDSGGGSSGENGVNSDLDSDLSSVSAASANSRLKPEPHSAEW